MEFLNIFKRMCGCKKKTCNQCSPTICGCGKLTSTKCINYEGNDLPCSGSLKGDRLESVIEKLDTSICGLESSILNNTPVPTTIYRAWADTNTGTGFTLTPSDKCFYAVTDIVATVGSPIVSDFTGKWFRINQPQKEFKDFKYINISTDLLATGGDTSTGGLVIPLASVSPITSVPVEFFNNTSSNIKVQVNFRNEIAEGGADQNIHIKLGNTETVFIPLINGSQGYLTVNMDIYYINSTSVRIIVEQVNNDGSPADTKIVTLVYSNTLTVSPTTTFDIQISGYSNSGSNLGFFEVVSQYVTAYNQNKITC